MNIDEYKLLMEFHMLMFNEDLSDYNYAAVDEDGMLWCYEGKPRISVGLNVWENLDHSVGGGKICMMGEPDDWTLTLIEI